MYHLIPHNNEHVLCSTILLLVSITHQPGRGRDSAVSIVTCYGLDSLGIESRWG